MVFPVAVFGWSLRAGSAQLVQRPWRRHPCVLPNVITAAGRIYEPRISRLREAVLMFRIIVTVLPLIAAIVAITIRHPSAVRLGAVSVIVLCFVLGLGGLIAPHRLAEESAGSPRSSEWQQGARDTRDVGYFFMPILGSSFAAAVLLALRPVRVPPTK